MKRTLLALTLLSMAACQSPIPHYMQDAPRSEKEARRIRAEIRRELGEGFHVEQIDPIFFVASNAGVRSRENCKGTISRMFRFLTRDYFKKKPTKPIRVFLFKNKKTYEAYCEKTYQKKPSTPFGFYMSDERKMVMNIATGTGTLAHELVHPLLAEDFPECPSWFNEGFASLFEQSTSPADGTMKGLINWRLPGLKNALRSEEGVSLSKILSTSTKEFYGDARGVNYGAARFLCYYLQERDLLRRFYNKFKETVKEDPTGIQALEAVTALPLKDVQKFWKRWTLGLHWED